MRRWLSALVTLLSFGCCSHVARLPKPNEPDADGRYYYRVGMEGFDVKHAALVWVAARIWQASVADLTLVVQNSCDGLAGRHSICIRPAKIDHDYLGFTYAHPEYDDTMTLIEIDTIDYNFADGAFVHVAEHELGHAFGLDHDAKNTVMWTYTEHDRDDQRDAAQNVTCADVKQFYRIRHHKETCP